MDGAGRWVRANRGWQLAAVLALSTQIAAQPALARPAGFAPGVDASDDSDEDDARARYRAFSFMATR